MGPGKLTGSNLPGWPRMANISEAQTDCVGFSYPGNETVAANETVNISLKVYPGNADGDATWTTWFKPALPQPFDARLNASQFPRQSTSYTSLLHTGESDTALLIYDQWLHHMGNEWRVYAMRIQFDRRSGTAL